MVPSVKLTHRRPHRPNPLPEQNQKFQDASTIDPDPTKASGSAGPGSAGPGLVNRSLATPATRRLARERGLDIQNVMGSGPGGRVTNEDVLTATTAAQPGATVSQPSPFATAPRPAPYPPHAAAPGASGFLSGPRSVRPSEACANALPKTWSAPNTKPPHTPT